MRSLSLICFLMLCFGCSIAVSGQITFQRKVDSLNGLFCIEQTSDGIFWVGAFLGKIIRIDQNGDWIGGYALKRGDTTSHRFVYDLKKAPGGGVYALYDRTNSNNQLDDYLILARLGGNGLPLWQSSVNYGEVLHWAHNRLAVNAQGDVLVSSARSNPMDPGGPNKIVLTKVRSNGTVEWVHGMRNDGRNFLRFIQPLRDGTYLLGGNSQLGTQYGFLLKLDANGTVIWGKRYPKVLFKAFDEHSDGSWALLATETGPLPQRTCALRMDTSGAVIWAKRMDMPNALNWIPSLQIAPNGDYLIGNYETPTDEPVADLICISNQGNFKWAKKYDRCRNLGISAGLITQDNAYIGLRYRSTGHLILKTRLDGACDTCEPEDLTIQLEPISDTPLSFNWVVDLLTQPNKADSDFVPLSVPLSNYCGQETPVSGFSLEPDTLCPLAPFNVSAVGVETADSYKWRFEQGLPFGQASGRVVNGFYFDAPGDRQVQLIANTGFCKDTFVANVHVLPGPGMLDLGPDTLLCGRNGSFVLDAATVGATDYLWQDGSTSTTFDVQNEGVFQVEARTLSCVAIDTIAVTFADGLTVNLPGDTTICGSDSLWLDATIPFADRYVWNDGVQTARRAINSTGFYAVTAYRKACSASDFVSVGLFPSPPEWPADTLLCQDDVLRLDAGQSLAGTILWNGQVGSAFFEMPGEGPVIRAIQYRQCSFVDTILVRRTDCNGFVFYAPNVFSPESEGDNRLFQLFGNDIEIPEMRIYDRWGVLLWSGKGIGAAQWDGNTVQGKSAPPDVYVWVARIVQRGKEGWLSGDVTLLR